MDRILAFRNSGPEYHGISLSTKDCRFESLRIQRTTTLIKAAKKHQTEVKYWVKKMAVTKQDKKTNIPIRCVLLTLEMKRGVIVTTR